jgi:hypothetical protein
LLPFFLHVWNHHEILWFLTPFLILKILVGLTYGLKKIFWQCSKNIPNSAKLALPGCHKVYFYSSHYKTTWALWPNHPPSLSLVSCMKDL